MIPPEKEISDNMLYPPPFYLYIFDNQIVYICINLSLPFENSAEVQYHFIFSPRQFLERIVRRKEHHNVSLVVCFTVVSQLKHIMTLDIWLHDENICIVTALHYFCYNIFGWRFTEVIDVRFECQSHHGNAGFAVVFQFKFQHSGLYLFRTIECLVVVDVTSIGNQFAFCRKIRCYEIRIDSNTVTAHTATRLQDIDTRMFVC